MRVRAPLFLAKDLNFSWNHENLQTLFWKMFLGLENSYNYEETIFVILILKNIAYAHFSLRTFHSPLPELQKSEVSLC